MPEKTCFAYGQTETAYLCARDPVLGAAIAAIGHIDREVMPDLFAALVHAIVGQQIATKAQATICARMLAQVVPMTAQTVCAMPDEALQACGISFKKAGCIRAIAAAVLDGSLDLAALQTQPTEAVCARLCQLRGIGVWTAEMLLLFSMQRPDVLSEGDLAIQRGLRMLYRHRRITPAIFARYRRRYAPYASVASLYLWAIAGGACPGLSDPAARPPRKADAGKPRAGANNARRTT